MVVQLFFQNFPEQCLWEMRAKYPSCSILSGVNISVFVWTNAECTRPKISEVALKKKGTGSFSVGILGLSFQTMINHVEPLFLFGPFTQKIPFDAKIFGLWTQGALVVISCDHDKCES